MSLNSKQENYLRKNVKKLSLSELSQKTELAEKDILEYFRKKWNNKKYASYLRENQSSPLNSANFGLKKFFLENKKLVILLFSLVVILYFPFLGNGFVSDDIFGIINNKEITSLKYVFVHSPNGIIQRIIYFFSSNLTGLNPVLFRLFNVIFHLGSVFMIFVILNILTKKRIALIVATLFAIHPIVSESIIWISANPYGQYSFFALLSFYFYIASDQNKKSLYWSLFFFVVAMIASEKATPLVLIFPLYELLVKNTPISWKKLWPFIITALLWGSSYVLLAGQRIEDLSAGSYQPIEMTNPIYQIPIAIASYLALIFWPDNLTLYHTELNFPTGKYALCLLIFLSFVGLIFYSWKKNRLISFWLLFFLILLLPVLTPFGLSWIVAERYVYLSSLGIFVIIAFGLDWLYEKLKSKGEFFEKAFYLFMSIIIIALGLRTFIRNGDWKNEDTLWLATAETSPSGQNIHNNLGDVYSRQGDYEKAVEEFKKAIEVNPNYADAYHNLANTYQMIGQIDLAVENYQKALEFNPKLWQSHQNLASIYFSQGDNQKALEYIKKALEINPNNETLQQNLEAIQKK